jgi:hypothetical protein
MLQFRVLQSWIEQIKQESLAHNVLAAPFIFEAAAMRKCDRKATSGFLTGKPGNRRPVKRENYYGAADADANSESWNKETDKTKIFKAHEKVMQKVAKGKMRITFDYGTVDTDITINTDVCVSKIENRLLQAKKDKMINHLFGVTRAYTYFCARNGMFAIHLEDSDALSANVHVSGDGKKYWICVMPESMRILEAAVRRIVKKHEEGKPEKDRTQSNCEDLMRHKELYLPVSFLDDHEIKYHVVEQAEGEMVVPLPRCYHQGFNWGNTANVAVNMVTDWWCEYGMTAKKVSSNKMIRATLIITLHCSVLVRRKRVTICWHN